MMNDFVNQFWNWYVILLVLLSIIACGVMLWSQSTPPPAKVDTTGHVWDETLEEYNNPLPKWWMWLFYHDRDLLAGVLRALPDAGQLSGHAWLVVQWPACQGSRQGRRADQARSTTST
jgi:cytochrome c oxidase cbb3-type subunit 3